MEGFTPGWNDPPKNVQATGNLKINLNKRVAFPLSSNSQVQSNVTPLLLPPISSPPTASALPSDEKPSEKASEDFDLQKADVLRILNEGVDELSPSIKSSVAIKLKTLEEDWTRADNEVKKLLIELSQFLDAKDTKNAALIQRKLVMKGCNGQWLVAVRQVTMNLEQRETTPVTASE